MPATAAPTIGATQNSQSCCSAAPPTNSAGPVERAGLTDVLVTGIEIRWIKVNASPMAIGAKPTGARPCGCAEDNHQEHEGQQKLDDQRRAQAIFARRTVAIAVGGKSTDAREIGLAADDKVEHRRCYDRAGDLREDIRDKIPAVEFAGSEQAHRNGGIEVATGNAAHRISHGEHGQAKSKRNADKSDAEFRKCRSEDGASAAAEDKPERAEKLGE